MAETTQQCTRWWWLFLLRRGDPSSYAEELGRSKTPTMRGFIGQGSRLWRSICEGLSVNGLYRAGGVDCRLLCIAEVEDNACGNVSVFEPLENVVDRR